MYFMIYDQFISIMRLAGFVGAIRGTLTVNTPSSKAAEILASSKSFGSWIMRVPSKEVLSVQMTRGVVFAFAFVCSNEQSLIASVATFSLVLASLSKVNLSFCDSDFVSVPDSASAFVPLFSIVLIAAFNFVSASDSGATSIVMSESLSKFLLANFFTLRIMLL